MIISLFSPFIYIYILSLLFIIYLHTNINNVNVYPISQNQPSFSLNNIFPRQYNIPSHRQTFRESMHQSMHEFRIPDTGRPINSFYGRPYVIR